MSVTFAYYSPLEQFQLVSLFPLGHLPIDISPSNAFLIAAITILIVSLLHSSLLFATLVPSRYQLLLEDLYLALAATFNDSLGSFGRTFFDTGATLFLTIASANLAGLVPYSFATTAQGIVSLGLSFSAWLGATLLGFLRHRSSYLAMFMPLGAPILLAPLLVSIELVSYLARPVSLGLRLAANITSGHILLGIIALFIHKMIVAGGLLLVASLGAISILLFLSILELGVALIQAYVFTLLVSLYYNDAVHLH